MVLIVTYNSELCNAITNFLIDTNGGMRSVAPMQPQYLEYNTKEGLVESRFEYYKFIYLEAECAIMTSSERSFAQYID
jgi:hypothetical protein